MCKNSMKFMRKFNEKLTDDQLASLQDFCDINFAYLYDEGFKIVITTDLQDRDRDAQFALAATYTGKTSYDRYIGTEGRIRVYSILLYKNNFEFDEIKDSLLSFLELLRRNNIQIFKGIRFKGLSHYYYTARSLDNIEEELYKIPGMYNKHSNLKSYKKDQMTLTSINIDLLEYDLSRSSII